MIAILLAVLVALAVAAPAGAQVLPSEPIQLGGGRLVIAGEVAASVASSADDGYFNYTDYKHNALKLIRIGFSAALRMGERLEVLGEVRTENWERLRAYALYVRVRPWIDRPIDIQAGRIPPTFGAFARRVYGVGNPLIGFPLAYQYLTSIRADALPASADDLLRMRGRGWYTAYPIGATEYDTGLPIMSAFRWDTGVQARLGSRPVQAIVSVTNGSLSNPRVDDDNGGKQFAGRVTVQPSAGLIVGLSAARGAYVSRRAASALPPGAGDDFTQRAIGLDVEYSRDHWLVRAEGLVSRWRMPAVSAPRIERPLGAAAVSIEGQYKIRAGLYAAARVDRLDFSRVVGTLFDGRPTTWDAPVSRLEVGGGYYVTRNVIAKLAYQHNWRDGGRVRRDGFLTAQLFYWF